MERLPCAFTLAISANWPKRFCMERIQYALPVVLGLALGFSAQAQTNTAPGASPASAEPTATPAVQQPAAAAAPAPDPPATWKILGIDVSGSADAYYSLGLNHPSDNVNSLRNFDNKENQPELNQAFVTLDYAANPVGFHADIGAGRTFEALGATEKDADFMRYVMQAYIDVKPASWKGAEMEALAVSRPSPELKSSRRPATGITRGRCFSPGASRTITSDSAPRRPSARASTLASSW